LSTFITALNTIQTDHETFRLKNSGTYNIINGSPQLDISNGYGYSTTIESWDVDEPAKLTLQATIDNGGSYPLKALVGGGAGTNGITLRGFLLELKAVLTSGTCNNLNFTDISLMSAGYTTTYENMCLVSNVVTTSSTSRFFYGSVSSLSVKGCTIINLSSSAYEDLVLYNSPSGTLNIEIDSNYIEGKFEHLFFLPVGTYSGYFDYNALYNDSVYTGIYHTGSLTITDGGHNLLNAGSASQFSSLNDIESMTIPNDLRPGPALIWAGNPSLGLSTDLVGGTRGSSPTIGAEEPASIFVNTFSAVPQRDSVPVISTINGCILVALIQDDYTDSYFDTVPKIGKVYLYYSQIDGRQAKTVIHTGTGLTGRVAWTSNAKSGVWQLIRAISIDTDGAEHTIERDEIGSESDLTLS
jgi:hypothetical protein